MRFKTVERFQEFKNYSQYLKIVNEGKTPLPCLVIDAELQCLITFYCVLITITV